MSRIHRLVSREIRFPACFGLVLVRRGYPCIKVRRACGRTVKTFSSRNQKTAGLNTGFSTNGKRSKFGTSLESTKWEYCSYPPGAPRPYPPHSKFATGPTIFSRYISSIRTWLVHVWLRLFKHSAGYCARHGPRRCFEFKLHWLDFKVTGCAFIMVVRTNAVYPTNANAVWSWWLNLIRR